MKYKLTLIFIFSLLVHITIAWALVYVPYQVTHQVFGKSHEDSDMDVIWGRIEGKEGRRQEAEVRSKKQEVINKKLEHTPPPMSGALTKENENPPLGLRGGMGGLFSGEPLMNQGSQMETQIPPLVQGGAGGVFSGELNLNTGNDDRVLLASSANGESQAGEGEEIEAEKGRIYNEQLKALIDQVKIEIEKNKYYPFLAKIKGIEGTVYLNFHIGQDGKPGSVAIQKSSGSKILDESAVKTITNLKPFRNINPELRELDIIVPITYRLREGS